MGGQDPQYKHNGQDYPVYTPPSNHALEVELQGIRFLFQKFCSAFELDISKFHVDEHKIIEAIIRVDQRKLHYKMYHKGTCINELKEAALLGYWLIRYKPLIYDNVGLFVVGNYNEIFALYLMFSVIAEYRALNNLSNNKANSYIIKELAYAISHRSVTYDSLQLQVELLAL